MHRIVALAALTVIGPGLALAVAVPPAGAVDHAARKAHPQLTASPAVVPTGGKVRVRGDIGTGRRLIRVQMKSGGTWHTVGIRKTQRNGRFSPRVTLTVKSSRMVAIRVMAPRAKVSGKTRPRVVTKVRRVKVTGPIVDLVSYEDQVLTKVNEQRAANGCGALTMQSQLRSAARGHSADMARHDYFSHDSRNGGDFVGRIKAAGYKHATLLAENIAAGQRTPTAVMSSWMHSPPHRANILNCAFTEIGIGAVRATGGWIYWTQDFGRR